MALELTELQELLTELERSMASGVLTVRHGDTTTTYRTLAEMERAASRLRSQIADANGTKRRKPRYVTQRTKGYGC